MKTNLRKVVAPTFVLVGLALLLSQSQLTAKQNIVQNGDFTSLSVWGWTYNFAVAEGYQNAAVGNMSAGSENRPGMGTSN
jgi:hypothetical protein